GGVFSTSVIARASGTQLGFVFWASSSATSFSWGVRAFTSASADKSDLPVEDLLTHEALRRLADAGERQRVDDGCGRRALEPGERARAEGQEVVRLERVAVL